MDNNQTSDLDQQVLEMYKLLNIDISSCLTLEQLANLYAEQQRYVFVESAVQGYIYNFR